VFAANVNLFWTRTPASELALIRRLLADHGFAATTLTRPTAASTILVCVQAEPG
jgi:hypothetical protein